ncbi:MAG: phasin family protein [Candidatus Competibacter sp.]
MKANLSENRPTDNIKDFARQIWLAGLGAFAKAQEEGGKFFEVLVQEGQAMDARMKKVTEGQAERARGGIDAMKDQAQEIREKATGTWNKLEDVFQTRVARALRRLGVPGRDDIQQLFEQVELLGRNVQALTQAEETEAKPKKARPVKSAEPAVIA